MPMSMAMPINSMAMQQQQYHHYDTTNRYGHAPVSPGTVNVNSVGSTLLRDVGSTFGSTAVAVPQAAAAAGDELGTDLGVEFASQNFGFDIDAIVDDTPPNLPSIPPLPMGNLLEKNNGNNASAGARINSNGNNTSTRREPTNRRFYSANSSGDNYY